MQPKRITLPQRQQTRQIVESDGVDRAGAGQHQRGAALAGGELPPSAAISIASDSGRLATVVSASRPMPSMLSAFTLLACGLAASTRMGPSAAAPLGNIHALLLAQPLPANGQPGEIGHGGAADRCR